MEPPFLATRLQNVVCNVIRVELSMDGDEESFCVPKGAEIEKIGSYEAVQMA
jgi:hypothetical protein